MRLLYKLEKFSVAKIAPRLTYKACWPSSLERQSVSFALRIFDETNVAALTINQSHVREVDRTQTNSFLDLICRVWKIFNINTTWKGHRLNDQDSFPLKLNDTRFQLLSTIVIWLEQWRALPITHGKLTPQTFTSFRHSCVTLPKLVHYLTNECKFSYVLTSFVQNDPIEHHFGVYRQMSGSNYNVSVCQVLESERVLKLFNILKLYTRQSVIRKDRESFMGFLNTFITEKDSTSDRSQNYIIDLALYESIISNEIADPDLETRQALAFIAGYAAFSSIKKFSKSSELCTDCIFFLTEDKSIVIEEVNSSCGLIQLLDRGGLKWPSQIVFSAVCTLWKVFIQIEQSPVLLKDFLISNSRSILIQQSILTIESEDSDDWTYECTDCFTEGKSILYHVLKTASNCILNNKAKNINSFTTHCQSKEPGRKILKLSSK